MFKTLGLFLLTNILVVVTITIVLHLLGIGNYMPGGKLDYGTLMAFCFVWGMGGAFISLQMSRWMAKQMMGVHVVDPHGQHEFTWLVQKIHVLSKRAGLTVMPEVGVYDNPELNAFATGPSKSRSLVAVSTGLLGSMNENEIDGVLSHEIAHIRNGDMVTMTLIQGVVNAFVMFFARIIAFAVSQNAKEENRRMISFLVTMVMEMALGVLGMIVIAWFSRYREFRADHGGAQLGGKQNMREALLALQRRFELPHAVDSSDSLATLKISGKPKGILALFSTHPPLEERIARLA